MTTINPSATHATGTAIITLGAIDNAALETIENGILGAALRRMKAVNDTEQDESGRFRSALGSAGRFRSALGGSGRFRSALSDGGRFRSALSQQA